MDEMNMRDMRQPSFEARMAGESMGRYTAKTFGWMFAGLLVTFLVAVGSVMTGAIAYLLYVPYWFYALLIAEVAVVIFLSARIEKMSVGMARAMFFLYAVLNGIVFGIYPLIYGVEVLWLVFGVTAVFFGVMALIGWFGNINFSVLRPFMIGGLVFLMVFWILSMFINLTAFETAICTLGIFLFLVFTAYDTKKIQAYYLYYGQSPDMAAKASIFAALQLYLDFINLFIYLLRVIGRRK